MDKKPNISPVKHYLITMIVFFFFFLIVVKCRKRSNNIKYFKNWLFYNSLCLFLNLALLLNFTFLLVNKEKRKIKKSGATATVQTEERKNKSYNFFLFCYLFQKLREADWKTRKQNSCYSKFKTDYIIQSFINCPALIHKTLVYKRKRQFVYNQF